MVETAILLAASGTNAATVLRDAATLYKVDTDAIAAKVKQEFAAKEKDKKASKPEAKPTAEAKPAERPANLRPLHFAYALIHYSNVLKSCATRREFARIPPI
jgi:ParB family chromosome partitioning protein